MDLNILWKKKRMENEKVIAYDLGLRNRYVGWTAQDFRDLIDFRKDQPIPKQALIYWSQRLNELEVI